MPSLITAGLQCLYLLVTACCQTSQDSNFDPLIQHVLDSALGEESFQSEMHRQKRNMLTFDLPPLEYTVDIEVSLMDSSFLEPIKEYFKNLMLPVSTNISNVEMTVSNINVTTVCLSNGENNSCCSCENGYAWPSAVCSDLIPCPSVSLAPDMPCGYMKEMPFYGPYCEPQAEDPCGMGEPIVMTMSVRLDTDFSDDLNDTSSELYKKYKADLEKAFNASYRCLPGFVSATVIGFRPGSVLVNYQVKAGTASFDQIANSNKNVPQYLNALYQLNQDTFITEITDQTNFTVSPVDIFEGLTVSLNCEINAALENVTWYHFDRIISVRFPYSVERRVSRSTSKSTLRIFNITTKDSGSYSCIFTKSNQSHTLMYKATKTIAVSPIHFTTNVNDVYVTCNSPEMQTNGLLLSCCIDRHLPSLTGDWKVNGAIYITGVSSFSENCTEYKLNINESLCPPEKSGTVTTYTCELQTGHGARYSQNISVTYLRRAHVTITSSINSSVSEGYEFNLTCESDVSNYESISWKIQSGNNTKTVDCVACIKNSKFPATSVLRVETATQDWSGTYICTFSQKYLESSANVTVDIIPLPLKQDILIDPIVAPIQCKVQQALECCISANTMEDYTVRFVVHQNEFHVGKKRKGNLFCYMYNYTERECSKEELMAYCKFINRIGQKVNSRSIRLHPIPGREVSCSDSFGIGIEGAVLIKPCRELNNPDNFTQGKKIYKCSNKSWKLERNDCLSVAISNLLISAKSLVNSPEAKANLPNYLAELKEKAEKEQSTIDNSPANLGAIVTILDTVSSIPANAEEPTIKNFLSTVDFIVADSTTAVWEDLNKEEEQKSSLLLRSVENFSLHLQPVNNTIPSVSVNTLQLQGIVVTENITTDYNKSFQSTENLTVNVLIGEMEIQTLTPNSTIVSVMYSKLGRILPQNKTGYVNGLLVTTTVSSNRSEQFDVNMTFAKKNLSLKKPHCVFWNFTLNHSGGWDTYGCTPTEIEDHVICSCNHLTSFSILMSPDISSQTIIEDYITYIGLAISILSLVACIIVESLVWKYVTNNTTSYMRHVCILNIAISLLTADIWFIVTASINDQNQQMSRGICFVATFFIHLFYLCVFFWMLSLGLMLFYRLVFIFHNASKTAQKAVAFWLGYGCPFVIAVITIAVTLPKNNYTRKDVCWLNWKDSKALLAFIIPALIIVAMNLFITAVVIIKILRPTIGDRSNRQERNSLVQIGKSVAILTPLLGLTWGFGLATVIKKSHRAFHILFALLNALQGLFILVFGTLWDKKIQEALLKRNSTSKWSSQQTKSTSLILVTPMLAMSYPFSRTFNNLRGKTGKYRVSSSEPSTSSSENTSKSYSLLN
ncbi:adhesion G protein-coupled receptor F5 isoform X2 [Phalacrocorax aristotelis]|uniref:adhesion G protein-coupled receptor F5 isoform X2 n=1 Tax=Phalacrocorax aristotelis TaxID=126867 RepID=UPI003F4BB196